MSHLRSRLTAPLLALALLASGCSDNRYVRAVQKTQDANSADARREGIFQLVKHDFARSELYRQLYRSMAANDPDWLVRASAIRALIICRDQQSAPLFVRSLDDSQELVRLEAALGLAQMPDPQAVPALLRHLNDPAENRDVRQAAAVALRHYDTLGVTRALAGVLDDRDFGVSWQARKSLWRMTGQDYRYNEVAWLAYLTGTSTSPSR